MLDLVKYFVIGCSARFILLNSFQCGMICLVLISDIKLCVEYHACEIS